MADLRIGRFAACLVLGSILAVSAACFGPSATDRQAIAGLQSAAATVQAELVQTPTVAARTATPPTVVATSASASLSGLLAPQPLTLTPPAIVGAAMVVSTDTGDRVAVTANSVRDSFQAASQYNKAKGRWTVIDWTITNRGGTTVNVSPYDFRLQTTDGFVVMKGNHGGMPAPELWGGKLSPGQTERGFVAYDVPAGSVLKSAIYEPLANPQFVIASLTP